MERNTENLIQLVSVIIPVYNVKRYLRQSIDSVLAQTYHHIEIVVVDDGSTDGSGEICDEFKQDPRVKVYHKENGGISSARNFGLERATGSYIAFLDSDDWMEPNAIQRFAAVAEQCNADIVISRFYEEYVDGPHPVSAASMGDQTVILEGKAILQNYICRKNMGNYVWNKIYRAELFNGIRFPEGMCFEDMAVMYKLMEKAQKAVCIPDYLHHYLQRKGSIVNSPSARKLTDYWIVNLEKYDALMSKDDTFRTSLVSGCVSAVGRMWCWYYAFTPEERDQVKDIVNDMQVFSKEHIREVLRGPYSKAMKLFCFLGRSKSPLVMNSLYRINKKRRNKDDSRMFE